MIKAQGDDFFNTYGYALVSEEVTFDKFTGRAWTQNYEGTRPALNALSILFGNAGGRTSLSTPGGKATLSVVWSRNPGSNPLAPPSPPELPVDRWEFTSEPYQISIFKRPDVAAEAATFLHTSESIVPPATQVVVYKGPAAYRKLIQDSVDAGLSVPFESDSVNYPFGSKVFTELVRGDESWETKRLVLSRTRSYSPDYLGTPRPVSLYTPVYTRGSLISEFNIPSQIASRIPSDPTSPPPPSGTVWGWREKSCSEGYSTGSRKIEERREWDFAAWSTFLYTIL